ncbi:hypothetical protein KR767_04190 [Luteibacter anthropi]|uniref:hypothetical protein n=1 Tax=Luteibacter anthropi TaxID=564369 RepID=UPI002032943E|nr:hypothetical protein [Luteibacter anthropi]URX63277.1 hypothetical protein KR767_04190 [Luteibacter anthropi]
MARPRTARSPEAIQPSDDGINHDALEQAGQALAEHAGHIAAIDQQFSVPMRYNLDAYIDRIKQNAAESAQRLIEIGMMLIQIREREAQGTWIKALEDIGMGVRFAQRAMQTAAKLHDLPRLQSLGVTKALELLSEDDDTLVELEQGGTLAGYTVDELDQMSVRELKAALRAERKEREEEKSADEEIIRAKDERINKLTRDRRKSSGQDQLRQQAEDLLRDADEAVVEATSHLARLRKVGDDINQLYADAGLSLDDDVASRIESNGRWAVDQLAQLAELVGE